MQWPAEFCRERYYASLEQQVSVRKRRKPSKKSTLTPIAFGARDPTKKWKMNKLLRERALRHTGTSLVPVLKSIESFGELAVSQLRIFRAWTKGRGTCKALFIS
eukprot:Gregarina_sp_Poly_1__2346@NODE_1628_length_3681_cov_42_123962_g1074_i0_p3_GENE_NODE_1628_length_3681_cov_42_123962_g1074_i0NODE_1628_length_3681_cov_42_123962_g1074_i0_p3_ORF_typecomplete_len104_score9_00Paf1/PF03985_13/0_085_NODE_1628_length_3681_cov_42_123962_g1074_i0567878